MKNKLKSVKTNDEDIPKFKVHKKIESNLNYDTTKWTYVPSSYCNYRYVLGKVGIKPIVVIGINPSTAEPDNLDKTLKSVERLVVRNKYDSYIMLNVYAQRATNPNDIHSSPINKLHRENIKAFKYIFNNLNESPTIWAAWGTNIEKRKYLKDYLKEIIDICERYDPKWVKVDKLTKKGHPRHPLYINKNKKFDNFDIKLYLKTSEIK